MKTQISSSLIGLSANVSLYQQVSPRTESKQKRKGVGAMLSGAEAMVKCLEEEGVELVFGYPGAAICPFYDALYHSSIRHVLVRSEQNAAHMASGYARAAGRPGVCIATSGPGATNLITGIATAYMDSIPIIAITGQVNLEQLGRDVFQEADITGACESFTKHSYLVTSAENLPRVFREAFHIAATGRPGPVLIDVPQDVQEQMLERFRYPEKADIIGYKPNLSGHPMQIKKAVQAIGSAKRPVICCGGGVVLAGAREEMNRFARKTGIPVVSTMMGLGAMSNTGSSWEIGAGQEGVAYLGMIGKFGRSYANRAIGEADLILLCGARVGDRAIALPNQIAEQAKIIHIDVDPAEIGKNMRVDIPIVGDIRQVLTALEEQVQPVDCLEWRQQVMQYKNRFVPRGEDREDAVEPRSFLRTLSRLMDEDAILAADPGQCQIWAAINFTQRSGRFLTSGGLGTMGYALPAALGAKLAKPRRQVVAICGDGAFQMSLSELAVICACHVQLKIIVMDNRRLGMVREYQNLRYGGRHIATHMDGNPDFVALCKAYGIPAALAENNAQAEELAREMLAAHTPYVLVCRVDPETPSI